MVKYFSTLICLLFSIHIKAQDTLVFKNVLSFHPFHLINNGIRIDYDRHLGKSHWLQIGPQFYAAERNEDSNGEEYSELVGAGVSVFHRIYLGEEKPSLGAYFSYGFTYNHYNLKYEEDTPTDNVLDETTIDKYGADIIIGYQTRAFDKLIFDVYAGLGGRYSDRSFKGESHRKFNETLLDYGFTGNVMVFGFRLGFNF
jgi:hypothetical protein